MIFYKYNLFRHYLHAIFRIFCHIEWKIPFEPFLPVFISIIICQLLYWWEMLYIAFSFFEYNRLYMIYKKIMIRTDRIRSDIFVKIVF